MKLMTRAEIASKLKKLNKCLILTHVNPDGDTIGSALALSDTLRKMGKAVSVYASNPVPRAFDFLDGFSEIRSVDENEVSKAVNDGYSIIFVDFAEPNRAGLTQIREDADVIVIDHHPTTPNPNYSTIIETEISSTAELIYNIIITGNMPLGIQAGNAIMAGILTDTGSFHYTNVTFQTLKVASELLEMGVSISYVSEMIYERATLANRKLLGIAMNRLTKSIDLPIAHTFISNSDIETHTASKPDLDFIIDEVRKLSSCQLYILGKEYSKGEYRISMRGRGDIDLNAIAKTFGGGGHRNASGMTLKGTWEEVIDRVLTKARMEFN